MHSLAARGNERMLRFATLTTSYWDFLTRKYHSDNKRTCLGV